MVGSSTFTMRREDVEARIEEKEPDGKGQESNEDTKRKRSWVNKLRGLREVR